MKQRLVANFKQQTQIYNIRLTGETAIADEEAARAYPENLRRLVQEGEYLSDFVFSVDDTGLYWKKMPSRTFLSTVKYGYKPAKERLTLLLGGNASGSVKLEPLLVCHSETPREMKALIEVNLPVIWTSERRAGMTEVIFTYWYIDHIFQRYMATVMKIIIQEGCCSC
jgi:hypothetical protein